MKIALISLVTPTPENHKAASALPYHIAQNRDKNDELQVFSFNTNSCNAQIISTSEKELNTKITLVKTPILIRGALHFKLFNLIRIFLKYPIYSYNYLPSNIYNQILEYNPDCIWIYGEDIAQLALKFPNKKVIITTPDCEAFFYQRIYSNKICYSNIYTLIRKSINYKKYINLEESLPCGDNIIYHIVGKNDLNALTKINPNINAQFIPHPHYRVMNKKISFRKKIKLLIAGRNDFYMHDAMISVLNIFYENSYLNNYYAITFLGKSWEHEHNNLIKYGYDSTHINYVEDYVAEIIKYDIQLTAISVGVGTKGKVLDALANGLLVVGNDLALENINVVHNDSCIYFSTLDELKLILHDIPNNIEYYEKIAFNGMKVVRKYHGEETFVKFFSLIKNNC